MLDAPHPRAPDGVDELLVKLAMRCDLACSYCYWFRDDDVLAKPPLLTTDIATALPTRLTEHLREYRLDKFTLLFHGGEPLLYGKSRFAALAESLRKVEDSSGVPLRLGMTTNGVLLDREWAELLHSFGIHVTVSIDGPASIHDLRKVDRKGRGPHGRVLGGLAALRAAGIEPAVLAVCDTCSSPRDVLCHLVDDLGFDSVDILVPDHHHDAPGPSIARYYCRLFDAWFDEFADRGVHVRYLDALIIGLLGGTSHTHAIGGGPITTATLLTDGSIEAVDTLRSAGTGTTRSLLNLRSHPLQSVVDDKLWREVWNASINLPVACRVCERVTVCGGGHIASRWSAARRYDNPSVYCADILAITAHISKRIRPTLYYEAPGPLLLEAQ